ncbi:aldo/keto reductase [Candidatus Palauibacter sp.]|uniref:aldo/keto reductase n=1 Tax=Candidatus Palauibacter sp. TaxID=3101350 RepID=UPI003B013EBC
MLTGLWQVADLEREGPIDIEAAAAAMDAYTAAGFTTFDMADHYGSAEEIAGACASRAPHRDGDMQLLTKWTPAPGPHTPETVREAVERSLRRLRTDAIDLLQFHAWHYPDPSWLDCLFALQELKDEGLIRHLGLTNFDAVHLDMVLHTGIDVVSNQVSYSLLDGRAAGAMTEVCLRHGVQLLAYGTLAGGLLTERWFDVEDPGPDGVKTWSEMKYRRFVGAAGGWGRLQVLLAAVRAVAQKHGVSMANVAARAILDRPAVAGVIIGARLGRREHIADNLRLSSLKLDAADRKTLAAASGSLDPVPGDCGDEYRRPPYLTAAGDLSDHLDELPSPYPVRTGTGGRTRVDSGTVWEDIAGYSRAVRTGDRIAVSGTTATHGDRLVGGDDPASQTHFVIDKIEGAIEALGGRLEDVVRTRIFVPELADWEPVARAHGHRFGGIRPVNTLVQAGLIGSGYRVEIEADARVGREP